MQRVLLLDELGEKFGAVHEYYNLRTPVDAIKLLCINHPEFQKELIESGEKGIGYKVVQAGAEFELEDMLLPFGSNDLIITPVIAGSGNGLGKVLIGAAMIGLAFATGGASLAFNSLALASPAVVGITTTTLGAIALNTGIALALGGVAQMLSPQPEGPLNIIGSSSQSGDRGPGSSIRGMDDAQSYAYRGPVNTVGKPGPHTMRVNGEKLDATFTQNEKASIGVKLKTWTEQLIPTKSPSGIADGSYTDDSVTYLRTPGSGSSSGATSIPLSGTSSEYGTDGLKDLGSITGESPSDARFDTSRFQMAFLLDNGLHDRAAGIGTESTYINGFITFQIVIKKDDTVVGTTQFTIQGMLLDSQDYRWATEFSFAKIEHQDTYTVYAKLIDFGGDPLVNTLRVEYMGYNFLGD